jgi:hypothetical protein
MFDGLVSSCFEESDNPDKQVPVELIEIYEHLDDVNSNNALPSPECVRKLKEFLVHEKQDQPLSSFFLEQNAAIEGLLKEENDTKLNALISIIWNHVFKLIGDHVVQNADDIVFNLGRQHFTDAVAGLHEFFIGTDFSSYVNAIFVCEQPSIAQRTVIIQLSKHIFEEFLKHLLKIVQQNQEQKRVELLNINRLHQENEEMVSKTITVLEKDAYVRRYWLDCFSCTSVENNLVS